MIYTAFSGGADSTALALLCEDAPAIFTDTGWEFPQLYEHIEKFELVTGRPVLRIKSAYPGGLPGYIRDYLFFPNHGARFCTREFKIKPFDHFLSTVPDPVLNVGLRADEPYRAGNHTDKYKVVYPLRDWGMDKATVDAVCAGAGLSPLYPPFMMRGGCMGCFYKRKSEIVALYHFAPEFYAMLSDLEQEVQDERGEFFYMFSNLGQSLKSFAVWCASQGRMFSFDYMYAPVLDVAPCGLFCNR